MAHQFGKKIAIHSYGPNGARDAVRAGDGLAGTCDGHGHATIQEMLKRGTFYVPTIESQSLLHRKRRKDRLCAGIQRKASRVHSKKSGDGTQGIQGGREVCDGLGCDLYHVGQNTRELGWFVKAGMTPETGVAYRERPMRRSYWERKGVGSSGAWIFCGSRRRRGRSPD